MEDPFVQFLEKRTRKTFTRFVTSCVNVMKLIDDHTGGNRQGARCERQPEEESMFVPCLPGDSDGFPRESPSLWFVLTQDPLCCPGVSPVVAPARRTDPQ